MGMAPYEVQNLFQIFPRIGRAIRSRTQNLQKSLRIGSLGAAAKELGDGFGRADFLGDGE